MFAIGVIFQKKGVQNLPEIKMSSLKTITPMLKNKVWLVGIICATLGGAPYIASQHFIGIGYTQLLMATGLILFAFLANRMLHEPLRLMEYLGISCIIVGSLLLGLAQLSPPPSGLLLTPGFIFQVIIAYSIIIGLLILGLIIYKTTKLRSGKNLALKNTHYLIGFWNDPCWKCSCDSSNEYRISKKQSDPSNSSPKCG
jgi:drug/metabolite transporter (DMT)-like permease